MSNLKILKRVNNQEIAPLTAIYDIYGSKAKRAHFIFMRINIKESKKVSLFINALFLLPLPIFLGELFINKQLVKYNISKEVLNELITCAGGTSIIVNSKEARVVVKLF